MGKIATPLTAVSTLEILELTYDIAKNGGNFHLVEHREPDAYGRPVARRIVLADWISGADGETYVQCLLNVVGQSLLRIKSLEDELSRAHTALQREAEPDSSKSRRSNLPREVSMGITNVLESGKEE